MTLVQRSSARLAKSGVVLGLACWCFLASACGGEAAESDAEPQAAGDTTPAPSAAAVAAELTPADFARLRFLEGDWRGTMPNGTPFFERYRVINDSTIQKYDYSDSTFTQRGDSSRIQLRDHRITNESATARWVVVAIDNAGVHFVPDGNRYGPFTWMSNPDGTWTATLQSGSGNVTYHMKPVSPRK